MVNTPPGTTGTAALETVNLQVTGSPEQIEAWEHAAKNTGAAIKDVTKNLLNFDEQVNQSQTVMKLWNSIADGSGAAFKRLDSSVSAALGNLNSHAALTTGQMIKLSAVLTEFGMAGNPFKNFKSDNLTTFGDTVSSMMEGMDKSGVEKFAASIGVHLPAGINLAVGALKRFVTGMVTNADSAVQMEDMYVRAGAATGQLGQIHEVAGEHLENMNKIVANQREMMEKAADATNTSSEQMAKFYDQISKVPGALKEMNAEQRAAIGGTDVLTATVRLARGTGMDYADVVRDMHEAIRDYNVSVPEAMKFTAQISEISQKYGVELKDVQDQLLATAGAFKYFGAGAEGAAEVMNHYVGALKETGLSGAVASDIVGNMTNQMSKMTLAQEAFLSAQQGGPGGLQGAFHIDNLLRQKDGTGIQKVFEMVKNQTTKMMGGNLVSSQEAEQSPQAAAQMTKQIMMLQNGPLGQLARTRPEAEHIIDMLKSGKSSDIVALAKDMSAPLDKGLDYQKQTATGISTLVRLVQHGAGIASKGALDALQAGSTAGAGTEFGAHNLKATKDERRYLSEFLTGQGEADTEQGAVPLMKQAQKLFENVPGLTMGAIKGIMTAVTPEGEQETEGEQTPQSLEGAMSARTAAQTESIMSTQTDAFGGHVNTGADQMRAAIHSHTGRQAADTGADQMKAAVHSNINRKTTATGSSQSTDGHPQMAAAQHDRGGNMGEITVNIHGMCINCGEKMKESTQRAAISPASK